MVTMDMKTHRYQHGICILCVVARKSFDIPTTSDGDINGISDVNSAFNMCGNT